MCIGLGEAKISVLPFNIRSHRLKQNKQVCQHYSITVSDELELLSNANARFGLRLQLTFLFCRERMKQIVACGLFACLFVSNETAANI